MPGQGIRVKSALGRPGNPGQVGPGQIGSDSDQIKSNNFIGLKSIDMIVTILNSTMQLKNIRIRIDKFKSNSTLTSFIILKQ